MANVTSGILMICGMKVVITHYNIVMCHFSIVWASAKATNNSILSHTQNYGLNTVLCMHLLFGHYTIKI